MSYSGEAYIKKLNDEEDRRMSKVRLVSDCCSAEVSVEREGGGETSPPEPYYACLKCLRKCDVYVIDKNEEEEM